MHEVKWDGMRVLAEVTDGRLRLSSRNGNDGVRRVPRAGGRRAPPGRRPARRRGGGSRRRPAQLRHPRHPDARAQRAPRARALRAAPGDVHGVRRAAAVRRRPADDAAGGAPRACWSGSSSAARATPRTGARRRPTTTARRCGPPPRRRASRAWSASAAPRCTSRGGAARTGSSRPTAGSSRTPWSAGTRRPGRPTPSRRSGSALPDPDGGWVVAGRVGSGIAGPAVATLSRLLKPLATDTHPFAVRPPDPDVRLAHWVEPRVVIDVRHMGRQPDGRIRQPVFRGVRTDLSVEDLQP